MAKIAHVRSVALAVKWGVRYLRSGYTPITAAKLKSPKARISAFYFLVSRTMANDCFRESWGRPPDDGLWTKATTSKITVICCIRECLYRYSLGYLNQRYRCGDRSP